MQGEAQAKAKAAQQVNKSHPKKDTVLEYRKTGVLIPYARNSRTHSEAQVQQIGSYLVYSTGEIYSLSLKKFLAQSNDKDGYKLVTMKKLKINKNGQYRVHRIIAKVFLGDCPKGYQVNHKDGNKVNNDIRNLEYVTCKQNITHARDIGLSKSGKNHHNTKPIILKKEGVVIKTFGSKNLSDLGFHPPSVHRVARGERKTINGWAAAYE